MSTPFSNALYYPHIDIKSSEWLKTAVLFWDTISTIVPDSMGAPYRMRDTEYLSDVGFLRPYRVDSSNVSVVGIEEKIIELLSIPEFLQEVLFDFSSSQEAIYEEKMSYDLRRKIKDSFGVYSEKFSYRLREKLRENREEFYNSRISSRNLEHLLFDFPHFIDDDKFYLSGKFAYIYMTALANRICENEVLGLVTDNLKYHEYAKSFMLDNKYNTRGATRLNNNPTTGQGLLLDLIIEDLRICPDTSFDDLINFKTRYNDELVAFKVQLANLTQGVSIDKPIDIMRKEIAETYKVFKADYNNLRKALKGSRIQFGANNFLKIVTFLGTVGGALFFGAPMGLSLLAGAGISATAHIIDYKVSKNAKLRDNPYSYLLAIQNNFS
jgi:hypothetical protein